MPFGNNCPITHLSFEDPKGFRKVSIEKRALRQLWFTDQDPVTKELTFRHVNHPIYPFYIHNLVVREQLKSNIFLFMKKEMIPNNTLITSVLKEKFTNEVDFRSFLMSCTSNIAGTISSMKRMKSNLKAIIKAKGPPTLFITVSLADLRLEILQKILGIKPEDKDLWVKIKNNPHICDKYFTEQITNFIEKVLVEGLKAKNYFGKFEH